MRDLSPYFDRDRRRDAQVRGYALAIWDAAVIALRLPQIVEWLIKHMPTRITDGYGRDGGKR